MIEDADILQQGQISIIYTGDKDNPMVTANRCTGAHLILAVAVLYGQAKNRGIPEAVLKKACDNADVLLGTYK